MPSTPGLPSPVPSLIQFLEAIPPPVTLFLVELSPFISRLRWVAEVVSWKSHWSDPWLLLAGWWAVCLSTNAMIRYLLPLVLLLLPLISHVQIRRTTSLRTPPTTEHLISATLSEITIIKSLIPNIPPPPVVPFPMALRLSAFLLIPYIILTHLVPVPILVGIAGTLLLTYRAPWARTLRTALWRSAYIRRFLLRLWSRLTGMTAPALAVASSATTDANSLFPSAATPASKPVRFLFTILECQRWWMGLDWTAALLPGERPSWCSISHQPVLPPAAFTLPPPTIVYLPAREGKRVERTATWTWEEAEWGVWINKEGAGSKRVEMKPPSPEEEKSANIATKAASMLRERNPSSGSRSDTKADREDTSTTLGQDPEHEAATDSDGWVYGDNKWEGTGPKGGIGKYTRYRRWSRVGILAETIEEVEGGELGIVRTDEAGPLPLSPSQEGRGEATGMDSDPLWTIQDSPKGAREHDEGRPPLKHRLQTIIMPH